MQKILKFSNKNNRAFVIFSLNFNQTLTNHVNFEQPAPGFYTENSKTS